VDIKTQFMDVSKKINILKEQLFHQNNQIKVLSRNKTYIQSMKINQILKLNQQLYQQIQQYQVLYNILENKLKNPNPTPNTHIKSILKKSSVIKEENPKSVRIDDLRCDSQDSKSPMRVEESSKPKSTLLLKKRILQPSLELNVAGTRQEAPKAIIVETEKDATKESEKELMKEFQSTLGALQKLLI
jgi:hypothetical protein